MMEREARTPVLRPLFREAADASVRARLGAAMALAVFAGALHAGAPVALKWLIDGLAAGGAAAEAMRFAALYVAALALARVAEQGQTYFLGSGEQRLQQRLSAAMFQRIMRLPMRYHLDRQTGGVMQTLTLGLQGARLILTHLAFSILPVLVQAVLIVIVVAGLFDAALWAVATAAIIGYCLVFAFGVRRLAGPTRAASAAQVEAGGLLADGLANVEPVKAFAAEAHIGARYEGLLHETERRWRTFYARRLENGLLVAAVFCASLSAVLSLGVWSLAEGRISIGDFVLLNTYLIQIVRPLEMAGFAFRDLAQGATYLERWAELLRTPAESGAIGAVASVSNDRPPAIRFENVSFAYGPEREVVSNVSALVPSGATLAVVGTSGAGKSSLLRLLLRYYEPTAGRILLDETPIDAVDLDALRRRIAVVAQDTVLFNDTLESNILFARPDADEAAVRRALSQAHLEELVARLPEGLATRVGERGLKLSGGEKQRVAIARAVLKDAPVLVLDEATSALDAETERAICADLIAAAKGRTTLIVTHRLAVAAHADEILVMREGQVVERGAHVGLLAAGGAYAGLWRRQHGPTAGSGEGQRLAGA